MKFRYGDKQLYDGKMYTFKEIQKEDLDARLLYCSRNLLSIIKMYLPSKTMGLAINLSDIEIYLFHDKTDSLMKNTKREIQGTLQDAITYLDEILIAEKFVQKNILKRYNEIKIITELALTEYILVSS